MSLCNCCKDEQKCAGFDDYAYLVKGDAFEGTSDSCIKFKSKETDNGNTK
jgi:hypothetical protein